MKYGTRIPALVILVVLAVAFLLALLPGCAGRSLTYSTPDGRELRYTNDMFDTTVGEFELVKEGDNFRVKLTNMDTQAVIARETINAVSGAVQTALKAAPLPPASPPPAAAPKK